MTITARRVVCAAVQYSDGTIICSPRHYDSTFHAIRRRIPDLPTSPPEQGFVDQWGNFLTREQARDIAVSQKQFYRRCGGDERELFSENLY